MELGIVAGDEVSAVERVVLFRERDGKRAEVVGVRRVIGAAVDAVWDAIADPARFSAWFLPVSGDLEVGGRFALEGNAEGEILRCDRPRAISVTWEFGGDVSWVDVRLRDAGGGKTEVEVEHTAHTAPEFWEEYGPGATGVGWELAFLFLAAHVLEGRTFSAREGEGWLLTEEGRGFVRSCSDAWVDPWIAAGGEAAGARAAAARTAAFYTGGGEEE